MPDNLPMNVVAFWVACFSIIFPLIIAFSQKEKSSEIKKLPLTPDDKKQRYYFLVWGTPIGIVLGFCIDIPIVFDVFGWHIEWFFAIIQGLAALFFIPIFITVMGFRGMSFLIKINVTEKRKGISEGIFISVIAWQVILFFSGRHDVLIPGFNESLQHMKDYFTSLTVYR